MVGVSFDTPDENRAFREAQSFPFPLWSDSKRSLGKPAGATRFGGIPFAKRVTVLVDGEGQIRYIYPDVSPLGHSADVLEDLAAVLPAAP